MAWFHSRYAQKTVERPLTWFKHVQSLVEILAIIVFVMPLMLLGHKNNVRLYRFLFGLVGRVPMAQKRAIDNLNIAYPHEKPEKLKKIAIETWKNLGNTGADFLFLPFLSKNKFFYTVNNPDILKHYLNTDQPVIFFSGHCATWEIFRIIASHHGGSVGLIYRAFNNPYFDALARFLMDYSPAPIFQKGTKGVKQMMRYLKTPQSKLLILTDQHLTGGESTTFFGSPVKTSPSVSELSLKYHMPLVPIFMVRSDVGCFELKVENALSLDEDEKNLDVSQQKKILLQKMNDTLERHIRQYPHEWFWLHNRWK